MKTLFVLSLGVILTGMQGYNLDTWKKNPSILAPTPFPNVPNETYTPNQTEPFVPPIVVPPKNDNSNPLPGILPQELPSDLPPPDAFVEKKQPLKKKEFLISYKLFTKDGIAQGERYSISEPIRSRIKSGEYVFDYQCRIDAKMLDVLGDDTADYVIKVILEKKKDAVLECLYKSGVQIRDDAFANNLQLSAKTTLTLPAKSVQAYLDNGFLILEVWKEKR